VLDPKEIPAPLPQKEPPVVQPLDKPVVSVKDTAYPRPAEGEIPLLRRSNKKPKTEKPSVSSQEKEQQPLLSPADEEEDKEIRRMKRHLEKKRLMKEERDLDKALEKEQKVIVAPSHPPQKNVRFNHPPEPVDQMYKQQLNNMKRSMLMEAIFGTNS